MAPSVSEQLPLLPATAGSASDKCRPLTVQLSGQQASQQTCELPSDFVVHLEDPKLDALPGETFGCLLMFCSALCYCMMQLAIRLVTGYEAFPAASFAALQGLAMTIFAIVVILSSGNTRAHVMCTARSDLPLVALRGILTGTGMNLVVASLSRIPLGTATSLVCLNPIFAIAVSSAVLGEPFGVVELAAALLSLVGVALVSNPTLKVDLSRLGLSSYLSGCVMAALAGWLFATAFVTVRSLGKRVHYLLCVMSVGVCTMLVGIATGGADAAPLVKSPMRTIFVLLGSMFGVLSQCFLNRGFQYCRAGIGSVILNADVPISYLFGVLFLAEIPSFVSLLGSTLVTVGTLLVTFKEILVKYLP